MPEKEQLKKKLIQIFDRYKWRDDIEEAIKEIGFEPFFEDPDEKIYFTPKRIHDILLYVNWINATFWIYERTQKLEIL